jgi:hypothetical protein
LVDDAGECIEYDIFFRLVKTGKGVLELIVETAFDRRPENRKYRPAGKPIRFWIILHNTLHGKPLRISMRLLGIPTLVETRTGGIGTTE